MKNIELIVLVMKALPYANQVSDVEEENDAIRFNWRGTKYHISKSLSVNEVGDGVLTGTDTAMLIRTLLERAR